MKTTVSICWIDDQPGNMSGNLAKIKAYVQEAHCALHLVKLVPSTTNNPTTTERAETTVYSQDPAADVATIVDGTAFDLVLVDYDLGGDAHWKGDTLLPVVRSHLRHTYVVFYSATTKPRLRELIHSSGVDGVYCCSREDLAEEVGSLVETMTKRAFDLTQFRGGVVSVATEHDHLIIDAIVEVLSHMNEETRKQTFEQLAQDAKVKAEKDVGKFAKLCANADLERAVRHPMFSAATRYKFLVKFASTHDVPKAAVELLAKYDAEVIQKRNAIAHQKGVHEGGKLIFGEVEYSEQTASLFRKTLFEHGMNLQLTHDSIVQKLTAKEE